MRVFNDPVSIETHSAGRFDNGLSLSRLMAINDFSNHQPANGKQNSRMLMKTAMTRRWLVECLMLLPLLLGVVFCLSKFVLCVHNNGCFSVSYLEACLGDEKDIASMNSAFLSVLCTMKLLSRRPPPEEA